MLRKVPIFVVACCLLLGSRVVSADFTLDHFPLDAGSRWTYSVSPSPLNGEFEGSIVSIIFDELTVSVSSEGRRRAEMPFTGTIDGFAFEGISSYEEDYNVGSSSIQLASESLYFDMHIPVSSESMTFDVSGTYAPPPTLFEDGTQIGESILSSGTFSGSLTMTYTAPGFEDSDTIPIDASVDTTVTITGEEQISFKGEPVDTLIVQIEATADGESSQRTWNLARFVGPLKMVQHIPWLDQIFDTLDESTLTLISTNLPVWETIATFGVDPSNDETLNFDVNGSPVEIVIPAGCLSDPCTIMVADISNIPASPGINGISWAVGINIEEPNITVNCPITVTIPYTQADLDSAGITDPNDLKVYRWSSPSSGWVELQVVSVDENNQTISFEVSQFSVFGSGAPAPTTAVVPAGGGGGGCLISTAAYGSRMALEIFALVLVLGFALACHLGLKKVFRN